MTLPADATPLLVDNVVRRQAFRATRYQRPSPAYSNLFLAVVGVHLVTSRARTPGGLKCENAPICLSVSALTCELSQGPSHPPIHRSVVRFSLS